MNLVKEITSDHDLIALADKLNINLDGAITIDEVKRSMLKGTYIVLLRAGSSGVGHWVAAHDGEYFDSTGVGPPTKLGEMPYNQIQFQGTYGAYCGIWCLLWLYSKQKRKPDLMKGFNNIDADIIYTS